MKFWIAIILSCVSACGQMTWSELSSNPLLEPERWYKNGAVIYITPQGLNHLEAQSPAILNAVFGVGIPITIAEQSYLDESSQHFVGGESFILRPQLLTIVPIEESNHISLKLGFQSLVVPLSLEAVHPGCKLSVVIDQLEIEVQFEAARDLLGNLNYLTVEDGVNVAMSDAMASPNSNCSNVSEKTRSVVLSLCKNMVVDAVKTTLTESQPVAGDLGRLAEALLALNATGRFDIELSDPNGQNGQFSIVLTAQEQENSQTSTLVSNGIVTVPLQIGIASKSAGCAEKMKGTNLLPTLATQAPVPNLTQYPADIVVALSKQALSDTWFAAAQSGLLCAGSSNPTTAAIDPKVIVPLLEPTLESVLDKDSNILLRLQPGSVPLLTFSDTDQSLKLIWSGLNLELYARIWNTRWLIYQAHDVKVSVTELTPKLNSNGELHLSGGNWSTDGNPKMTALVKTALLQVSNQLTFFVLPEMTPYPLKNARFELQNEHLIMYADLATHVPPKLGTLDAAISVELSPTPTKGTGGCSVDGHHSQPVGMLLLLFAALMMSFYKRSQWRAPVEEL
ncbi:MAG TPA: hypothetical protein EYN06_07585 [Myxococcales bacterium]|nr:hypothetical protein [Myxococcales bacterium]